MKIKGYTIICTSSSNHLSHDWGGEFYHQIEDAEIRCNELHDVAFSDGKFIPKEAILEIIN
jgi:hypothetical protein